MVKEEEDQPRLLPRQLIEELSVEKHVLRIQDVFGRIDSQRKIFPNGLITRIEEDKTANPGQVKRIEQFAINRKSRETHGILRNLFLGFSDARDLLDLANFSNWVISIRSLPEKEGNLDSFESKIMESKLVLKRRDPRSKEKVNPSNRLSSELVLRRTELPSLYVSSRYLDRMDLESGDCIMVSNTVENYSTPPPEFAGDKQ